MSVQLEFVARNLQEVEMDLIAKMSKSHRAQFRMIGELKNELKKIKEELNVVKFRVNYPDSSYDLIS